MELTDNKSTNEGSRIFSITENDDVVKFQIVNKIKEHEMVIDGLCSTIDDLLKENERLKKENEHMYMRSIQQKEYLEEELWEQMKGRDL